MHLLRVESRSIDDMSEAVDLGQSPADIVVLSFSDTDLAVVAVAWEIDRDTLPSLRLASLAALRHPYSVDLYGDKVLRHARFVLVRLLGGMEYWRYGVEELATLARVSGFHLAIVPGDQRADPRLDQASTLPTAALRQIAEYFSAGGIENVGACLRFVAGHFMVQAMAPPAKPVPPFGFFAVPNLPVNDAAPVALIVFYRAVMLAADNEPVVALAKHLSARGFRVSVIYVTSLKDQAAAIPLRAHLRAHRPDVILNLTAFSARQELGGSVLDEADAPVLQLALSGGSFQAWVTSHRGLGAADLAMNVVLPEFDGRIIVGAISFKGETQRNEVLQFTRVAHRPEPQGLSHAADLAYAWADLARTPRADRRLACILSDYPAKGGRTGYAVGLDTPASVVTIASRLVAEGYDIDPPSDAAALGQALSQSASASELSVADYERLLEKLPADFTGQLRSSWGNPSADPEVQDGVFRFRIIRSGKLIIAVQPDRGDAASRKTDYHDATLPPRHSYVAFYLWLREIERVHAIIHCGTHGTLEWLPGKAMALSNACAPRAVLGPVPLIYPFIVNNPGEAAQSKRRTSAVTIGHMTPPLMDAGSHGSITELENLFDEYADAQSLDPRRAARLAELIMERARDTGLAAESGVASHEDASTALAKLDAWLCDLKDMQIGDGLHVFGMAAAHSAVMATTLAHMARVDDTMLVEKLITSSAEAEMHGLLAALDGRFVPPGPAGAPSRGRLDVLPTGRNLYSVDPRAVPTRTAWELGKRTADALMTRHAQDHGDWPKRVVLDVWGSATMRTGGDDLAQAFALLGVCPRWDSSSARITGFGILPLAVLNRPRVDVTLRISGLFRDVFPMQIALFDNVVRVVAALDENSDDNPLAASLRADAGDSGRRVFGAAPGAYGVGLTRVLAKGDWSNRDALGEAYLQASTHSYGGTEDGVAAAIDFRRQVAAADAFVHVQDMSGQDVLDADAFAEHEGGFAAAAAALGNHPALYHADTINPDHFRIRTLREEVARVLRARAINPRWLTGQMRHGFRGAAEIAQTVDNFCAYAALADVVTDRQFDLLYDAILGDDSVRQFLFGANPEAATAIVERFQNAIRRGLWVTRRNTPSEMLGSIQTALR